MLRIFITLILAAFAFGAQAAVDVNKANQAELESIKGIGPGLSTKIIDARKTGSFKDWGDLVDRVSGVGPGNAARFSQAGLAVGGVAYVASADKPASSRKGGAKADAKPAMKAAAPVSAPAR
jgi:competence protein ComEA